MDALDAFAGNYSTYLTRMAEQNRIPLSGTFELLPYCNMNCKMCYIVHGKKDFRALKDIGFWNHLLDQAIDSGMLYCLLTGGEPFLYPQIWELLECINKKPIHLAINSNGTMLNEERIRRLSKVYPGRMNISLYGGSNETYDRLCGNPMGYTEVTQAFGLMNEHHIPYRVHATLTPDNYEDFDRIVDTCNRYHAPLQMVYYMFPPYRKISDLNENSKNENNQKFCDYGKNAARFTPQQAAEVAIRLLRHKYKDKKEELRMILEANCACFNEPERFSIYGKRGIACRQGITSFWVDWTGAVSGCGIHTVEHIDLNQVSFADAWKVITKTADETVISEKCSICPYRCICPVCAAAAFCETGDVAGTPEYLCEFSEIYAQLLLKELEEVRKEYV